jgi:hypothetical protein
MQGKDGVRDNDNRFDAFAGKLDECDADFVCVACVRLE